MPATRHRDFLQKPRVLLLFIEFNILIFLMICRQTRTHPNPGPTPAPKAAPSPQLWLLVRRKRKPPNQWVMPRIIQREERGCYRTLLSDLIQIDIPGYQNFVRMPPAFFDPIKECIHHRIKKSATNFRKPLEVGLKLIITMRHLATGETYMCLQYHLLVS